MLGWLKKRKNDRTLDSILKPLTSRLALAESLEFVVDRHFTQLKMIGMDPPVLNQEASILSKWFSTRYESMGEFRKCCRLSFWDIAKPENQKAISEAIAVRKIHRFNKEPIGSLADNAAASIACIYLYLDCLGTPFADSETCRITLHSRERRIVDQLETDADHILNQILGLSSSKNLDNGADLVFPDCLLEKIYLDVTRKSKSIAITSKFGSNHASGIAFYRGLLLKNGIDISDFDMQISALLDADDPEDVKTKITI